MSLNVCHIISGDRWAGAEVQVAALLKYLAQQSGVHLAAIVLNAGRLADELRASGVELHVISESDHSFRATFHQAEKILRGRSIQVLHSHRYKENLLAALLRRRCGIPVIVRTQHGLPEPQQGPRKAKQGLIQLVDRSVGRWTTDCIISVSSEMTETLARQFRRSKIQTIPNGADLESVGSKFSQAEAKSRLGLPADAKVIGTAGRLEPIKRLDLFLETSRRVLDRRPGTRFIIAGEGREESFLRAQAEALGIADTVRFLGHRDDVHDVLRALDIMALTSDHEGLPMVLLEAMALEVLVVSRQVGGIPEVIQNGICGILVDSADPAAFAKACVDALDRPEDSLRMTQAALARVREKYSAERTAREVRLLYNSLLNRP